MSPKGVGLWVDGSHVRDPDKAELFLSWREIVRIVQAGAIPDVLARLQVLGEQRKECIGMWQDRYYRLNRTETRVCLYKRDVVEHEQTALGYRLLDRALELELATPAAVDDQLSLF